MDFKEDIQLLKFAGISHDEEINLPFVFAKNEIISLNVKGKIFDNAVLAWVVS